MGPISQKITAGLKKAKNRKIINFQELKEAKTHAENLLFLLYISPTMFYLYFKTKIMQFIFVISRWRQYEIHTRSY